MNNWKPDPKKRVAIVGFAGTTRGQVPYDDKTIEVWSLNNAWQFVPDGRWARWFELHPMSIVNADFQRPKKDSLGSTDQKGTDRYEWLKRQKPGKPIYMQKHQEDIPASVAWPREEVNAFFAERGANVPGYYSDDYYSSSISEMLAHAIMDGYGEIHLYGVDMLQDEEYYYQRSGCEYYIGFARGAGIKVYVPKQSALCQCGYVYGYTEPPPLHVFDNMLEFLERQETQALTEKERAMFAAHVEEGRLQMLRHGLSLVGECSKCLEWKKFAETQMAESAKSREQALASANLHEGAKQAFSAGRSWGKHEARGGKL